MNITHPSAVWLLGPRPRGLVLLLGLLLSVAAPVAAQYESPYSSSYGSSGGGSSNPYSRSPSQQFTPYADGSSRPVVPDHLGKFNDSEHASNQRSQQQQQDLYAPKPQQETPPQASHDYNMFTPDGKMHLCTATKDAVYCR